MNPGRSPSGTDSSDRDTAVPDVALSPKAGRAAGRVLVGSLIAFDLVFLLATLTNPTWWRWPVLVVIVVAQLAFARLTRLSPSP
ncbi:hypothetical protein EV188_103457 [Actinomycetospora succinea]|uniref:Uncharacterized protein n=1 Tax=Actinomycetospora succinea TaxID=663603 RepID=A0A4R6VDS1_9PSEU|nr:hypothetical protein [Actinomycetospora succinea]TDQ60953.1 hypothetical protein EV188_103457 [Actinomycetospora succinea]